MEPHACATRKTAGAVLHASRNVSSIALYLGADIGGMGSKMTVNAEDGKLYWNIEKRDGTTEQVVINQKESNKY